MSKKKHIFSEEGMHVFARETAKGLSEGTCIALHGELGAGKTTFSQGFLQFFGVDDVASPTYSIVNTYEVAHENIERIYHFDLYRVAGVDDLHALGFEEMLHDPSAHVLIEWAEKADVLLPKKRIDITIQYGKKEGQRIVEIV